jgi:hypothetical protein
MIGFRSLAVAILAVAVGLAGAGTTQADTALATPVVSTRSQEWSPPVALSRTSLSLTDTGTLYCHTIAACDEIADLRRTRQRRSASRRVS